MKNLKKTWLKEEFILVIPELLAAASQNIEILNDAEPIDFMRLLLTDELASMPLPMTKNQ